MAVTAAAIESGSAAPRWPGVVGMIGIVLAALTLLDKVGDLLFVLLASGAGWSSLVGAEAGRIVDSVIPPTSWLVLTSLVWLVLALVLLAGSLRLRRRERSGLALCRAWAWLVICWYAIELVYDAWWLSGISDELDALAPGAWQAWAVAGTVLASILMLAFPVFLLVWLARPEIRRQTAEWPAGA